MYNVISPLRQVAGRLVLSVAARLQRMGARLVGHPSAQPHPLLRSVETARVVDLNLRMRR